MAERFPAPPAAWPNTQEHLRKIALAVAGLLGGKSNNTRELAIAAGASETVLEDDAIGPGTLAFLAPLDQAAADDHDVWQVAGVKRITFHHAAGVTRRFGVVLVG